jgi:predicted N-acetyltransferase YhbS
MLRLATRDDIPAIVDIECRAFGRESADHRQRVERKLEQEWPEYVVLEEDGQTVASAHVARHRLRVGSCSVLKGDVGHVAVPPELQGRGYGTTLMQKLIPHMAANGFHVSRLGGLMKFYARFGYEPFPRRYVHIPVPRFEESLKGQNWGDLLHLSPELASRVRPYHPARDHAAVHRLRCRFDATRSGQRVEGQGRMVNGQWLMVDEDERSAGHQPSTLNHGSAVTPSILNPQPSTLGPTGLAWVYEEGPLRGFLRGALALVHAGDAAPSYRLDELVFDEVCPEAAGALVKRLMQRAQDRAPTRLSCRLPYDETVFAALTAAGIAFEVVELHPAADGNMMRVVNLPETLRAVEVELSDRLKPLLQLPWEGTVTLVLPEETAALRIGSGGVQVTSDHDAGLTVTASQADFLKWLFGIAGFAEFPQAGKLAPGLRLVLACLFPRLPCASGPWG